MEEQITIHNRLIGRVCFFQVTRRRCVLLPWLFLLIAVLAFFAGRAGSADLAALNEVAKLQPIPSHSSDFWTGAAISYDGDILAVGVRADHNDGSRYGAVYLYRWNATSEAFDFVTKLTGDPNTAPYSGFGADVDVAGDLLVVGARREHS